MRLNYYLKQKILFRGALVGGDSVLYFVREGDDFDLVEFPGSVIDEEKTGNNITLGIKHDDFYRKKSFFDTSGKEVIFTSGGRQNVVQFYDKKLPRQLRGYPLAYSCISLAKNLDRFHDATLQTAIAESMFVFFTSSEDPAGTAQQIKAMADASQKKKGIIAQALESIGNTRRLGAGNMLNMRTSDKITSIDKKTPSSNFAPFNETMLDYIGMGTNVPPEVIKSRYGGSFTAHKGALNDFKIAFMAKRSLFCDQVNYPVLREVATNLILSGAIKAPSFITGGDYMQRAWLNGIYLGPVPGHINPLQEVNAKIASVNAGFTKRSDESFSAWGGDYEDAFEQWAEEERAYQTIHPDAQAVALAQSFEEKEEEEQT
jgi:capsid protein